MIRRIFLGGLLIATSVSTRGDTVDEAILAAMKLPEAKNYTWIAAVQDDGRFYTIDGKTERDGYTLVNMPMVSAIQRKLGIRGSDAQTAIFKGNESCVIATANGWKTPAELTRLPEAHPPATVYRTRHPVMGGMVFGNGVVPAISKNAAVHYSNLQLNLSHPHDEVGIIVGCYRDAHAEPDGISGILSEEGARLLLVHPGQNEITPLRASGAFRFWLKQGVLVRYEVSLTGTIAIGSGASRLEITLHQNTMTELEAVDATTVPIPEEAKRKLG